MGRGDLYGIIILKSNLFFFGIFYLLFNNLLFNSLLQLFRIILIFILFIFFFSFFVFLEGLLLFLFAQDPTLLQLVQVFFSFFSSSCCIS